MTPLRTRLAHWFDRWRADAGTQGRVIPSQAERWRAMQGGSPPQVVASPRPTSTWG